METEMKTYFARLVESWQKNNDSLPMAPWNEDSDTFIYEGNPDEEDWICWKPTKKSVLHDFTEIETRLGIGLHKSIKDYFNSYWFCTLGGVYGSFKIQLDPVMPGIELKDFLFQLEGYIRTHNSKLDNVPIGIETGQSLLVVVDNKTGEVKIEDFEQGTFEIIANSLEDIILGMAKKFSNN